MVEGKKQLYWVGGWNSEKLQESSIFQLMEVIFQKRKLPDHLLMINLVCVCVLGEGRVIFAKTKMLVPGHYKLSFLEKIGHKMYLSNYNEQNRKYSTIMSNNLQTFSSGNASFWSKSFSFFLWCQKILVWKGESFGSLQRPPVLYQGRQDTKVQDLLIQHSAYTMRQTCYSDTREVLWNFPRLLPL